VAPERSASSIEPGRPITFGLFNRRKTPGAWRTTFDIIERTAQLLEWKE